MRVVWACILVLYSLLETGAAQKIEYGGCPKKAVKQDFDINAYLGTWYQMASFGTELVTGTGKCVKAVWSRNSKTNTIDVERTQLTVSGSKDSDEKKNKSKQKEKISATAKLVDETKKEGKLTLNIPFPVIKKLNVPYSVLATDYKWALVYSCIDLKIFHISSSWILMKDRTPNHGEWERVTEAIKGAGLARSMYIDTDQKGCPLSLSSLFS